MERCYLGLDIGIASVGWAVVGEESQEILESGVRLFNSADVSKNEDRRRFRGIRRNKRRQHHRLERLDNFLGEFGFFKPENINLSPVELRFKGLTEELSKEELYAALYNIVKHRGVSYIEDLEEAKESDSVVKNIKTSKFEFPCEIQLDRLQIHGFFRGTKVIGDETFINTFTLGMYESEARKILTTQQTHHPNITLDFIDEYITILRSKREYYIGPGNELSRTNYGVYKTSGETKANLFDELRGKCSVYNGKNGMEGELRASGASYTAQHYNLLNDLCNIQLDGRKLTKAEKELVMNYIKEHGTAVKITNALKKLYKADPSTVSGYRIDRNGKEENHTFEIYRMMRKDFEGTCVKLEGYSPETLDAIGDILTINTETQGMLDYFRNEGLPEYTHVKHLTDAEIELFIDFRRNRGKFFDKWSSFSYKLIKQIVPEMLETGDEQHTCVQRMDLRKYATSSGTKLDYLGIVDEIYNPVVTRSIVQTIKIVNALIKKYDFINIVVEMPRDGNSEDENQRIKSGQKANEKLLDTAIAYSGLDAGRLNFRSHNKLRDKLKMYYKQQGKCLYSGRSIDIDRSIACQ